MAFALVLEGVEKASRPHSKSPSLTSSPSPELLKDRKKNKCKSKRLWSEFLSGGNKLKRKTSTSILRCHKEYPWWPTWNILLWYYLSSEIIPAEQFPE